MKKKNLKWIVAPVIAAIGIIGLSSVAKANQEPTYVWGTFGVYAGIATCSGTANDCTHPAPPAQTLQPE